MIPVYLVHWCAVEWCASAVRTILASEGCEVTVHVVNNSPDLAAELRAALPDGVAIIETGSNTGYTGGANTALAHAARWYPKAAAHVVASHDIHVEPDTLARCLAVLERRPDVGIVGPYVPRSSNMSAAVHDALQASDGAVVLARADERAGGQAGDLVEVEWISGQCLVIRPACAADVGPFDERLGSYCEDVDYGERARAAGWVVAVCTSAHARGLGSASSNALQMIRRNRLLLAYARGGHGAHAVELVALARSATRNAAGAMAVWRPRPARAASAVAARALVRVLVAAPGSLARFRAAPAPDPRAFRPAE